MSEKDAQLKAFLKANQPLPKQLSEMEIERSLTMTAQRLTKRPSPRLTPKRYWNQYLASGVGFAAAVLIGVVLVSKSEPRVDLDASAIFEDGGFDDAPALDVGEELLLLTEQI